MFSEARVETILTTRTPSSEPRTEAVEAEEERAGVISPRVSAPIIGGRRGIRSYAEVFGPRLERTWIVVFRFDRAERYTAAPG